MKRIGSVALVTIFSLSLITLTGCKAVEDAANNVAQGVSDAVGQLISGDVTGEIAKDYRTQWFTFNVKSVTKVSSYAGITPAAGNDLIDVVIYEKNDFSRDIPMSTYDFFMDAPSFAEYVYPVNAADSTMMPTEFNLAPGESATYHLIYEVPANVSGLILQYIEIDERNTQGATFTVNINL